MTPSHAIQAFRAAVLAVLGHAPVLIEPGRVHRFGTSDRGGDDAGWCKLFDDLRGGVFGCMRAGTSEAWRAHDRCTMTATQRAGLAQQLNTATAQRRALQRCQWAQQAQRNTELWAQCVPPVPGDPVSLYLERRGLAAAWPLPSLLRTHPAMPYWHGARKLGSFPALVAPILAPDGRAVALHRTFLAADGRKAAVPSPKKLTGAAGPLSGACIPLHQPARGCIGIAEGIETALAAFCASAVPTVAAYCAGNLAAWRWPAGVQRLVIFADADKAGREAADTLRARALAAGLRVEVLTPTDPGADWCDVWAERDAVMVESGGTA
jgi:putative DNA primase/helicase